MSGVRHAVLRYLQWLAVAGVWIPVIALALWFGVGVLIGTSAPSSIATEGWGLVVVGMLLAVVAAHALALSSIVGVSLLVLGKARRFSITLLSVVVGVALSGPVLARVYFNLNTLPAAWNIA